MVSQNSDVDNVSSKAKFSKDWFWGNRPFTFILRDLQTQLVLNCNIIHGDGICILVEVPLHVCSSYEKTRSQESHDFPKRQNGGKARFHSFKGSVHKDPATPIMLTAVANLLRF